MTIAPPSSGSFAGLQDLVAGRPPYPPLAACGFLYNGNRDVFEEEKAKLLSPAGILQVCYATAFLTFCSRAKVSARGSYGLKHVCEDWVFSQSRGAYDYVSNGALIAAAIQEGFMVRPERNSPNARINVGKMPGIITP